MRDQPILLVPPKPRVLMICAHEPTVDPRIRWEAEFAAQQFEVTVLGFKEKGSSAPDNEDAGYYKIVRLERFDVSPIYYLWRLKDVLPRPLVTSLLIFGLLVGVKHQPATVSLFGKNPRQQGVQVITMDDVRLIVETIDVFSEDSCRRPELDTQEAHDVMVSFTSFPPCPSLPPRLEQRKGQSNGSQSFSCETQNSLGLAAQCNQNADN